MQPEQLISAIRAALDETERLAKGATAGPWTQEAAQVLGGRDALFVIASQVQAWNREHIAHNDPAAVLRRVAADREIVDAHAVIWRHTLSYDAEDCEHETELPVCVTCVPRHASYRSRADVPLWPCKTVQALARGLGINPEETDAGPSPTR